MKFPLPQKEWTSQEWSQLKNLSPIDMISLIGKDDRWELVTVKGNKYIYRNPRLEKPHDILEIHYHKKEYRNKGLIKFLLNHWCCTRADLKRWKIIKG